MASTRDIRRRIKSVKNTRQITKAMELVAASKMKKAQQAALSGRPYAELMAQMLGSLAERVEEAQHPFLVKREVAVRGIILITSTRRMRTLQVRSTSGRPMTTGKTSTRMRQLGLRP